MRTRPNPRFATRVSPWAVVVVVFIASVTCDGRGASAQQPFSPPEAMVFVQPAGHNVVVSVSYAGKYSHDLARQALNRFATLANANVTKPVVEDVEMKTNPGFGVVQGMGTQTGVTAVLTGGSLVSGHAFVLQPFVDAYRDLKRFEILYWVAPQKGFNGLRSFESASLSVQLIQEGGPYRYSIVNHTGQGRAPRLPLTQIVGAHREPGVSPPASPLRDNANQASNLAPVAGIAVIAGLTVFVLLRIVSHARNRGRNQAGPGRTSSTDSQRSFRI